jgi:hypothetical protein
VPEAKANGQGRDNPDTPDHVGTGNTPTLTAEEREAILGCTAYDEAAAAVIRNLLERLS